MTSSQMYEFAKKAVSEAEKVKENAITTPDVLWVGGVLEIRRAIVWYGEKLYLVTYNTNTDETNIETYVKEGGQVDP